MSTSLAFAIVSITMAFIGLMFNLLPKQINKLVMGDIPEGGVNPAASLCTILGAAAIIMGVTAFYCRNLPEEHVSMLLTALGIGFIVLITTIILTKIRKLADHIRIPPIVTFIILAVISFSAA